MSKYPGRIITDLAPTGYSVTFDGTGDYLSLPDNAAFSGIAANDWTVEAWVNTRVASTLQTIITISANSGTWAAIRLMVWDTNNGLYLLCSKNATAWDINYAAGAMTPNTWNHVAACRSGNNILLFINGVQVGVTQTLSGSLMSGTLNRIGITSNDSTQAFNGLISNVRYVRGTALYTSSFNPPTQLLNITNTQLLTCNSPSFVDQSSNSFAVTANGNAAISTLTPFTAYVPYNPALGAATPGVWTVDEALQAAGTRQWNMYDPSFTSNTMLFHGNPPVNAPTWLADVSTNNFVLTQNGDVRLSNLSPFPLTTYSTSGSGYFDGTGDYLSNTSAALITNAVSTFTVECWVYLTANPPANGNNISALCTLDGQPAGATNFMSFGPLDNRRLYLFWFDGSVRSAAGNTAISLNTWTHIACVVNSNSIQFYVNGVAETMSGTTTLTNRSGSVGNFAIGSSSAGQITGYISNFRATTTAVYTGAFTTPTAPLTAVSGTRILTLQSSQSANNNAFLDSSSNNFLITRNGNTTQGSFSPYEPNGWGLRTNDRSYLSIPASSDFDVINTDFTAEFWFSLNAFNTMNFSGNNLFGNGLSAAVNGWSMGFGGSGTTITSIEYRIFSGGAQSVNNFTGLSLTLGVWYHVALQRNGSGSGNLRLFVNGVQQGAAQTANTYSSAGGGFTLGSGSYTQNGDYSGNADYYISNMRLTKAAVYSTNGFTPSTVDLVRLPATTLLICQSARLINNGTNTGAISSGGFTGTRSQVVQYSPLYPATSYNPAIMGGSGYFDGTGDYLVTPTSSNLSLATNTSNFSFECWVYNNGFSGSQYGRGIFIYYPSGSYVGTRLMVRLSNTSDKVNIFLVQAGNVQFGGSGTDSTGVCTPSAWTHVAFIRNSNLFYLYLNGVLDTTLTASFQPQDLAFNTYNVIEVGRTQDGSTPDLNGYISGFRFVRNSAVYTTNFTPPTAPPTAITNTALLLNFTNAGVVDSTSRGIFETLGATQLSTSTSKFGGSSISFNGTNSYLLPPVSPIYQFYANDFTIEFWVRFNTVSAAQSIYDSRNPDGVNAGQDIFLNSSGRLNWGTATALYVAGTTALSTNVWYHVACVRQSTTMRMFLNGVQEGTTFTAGAAQNFTNTTARVGWGAQGYLNGFIEELRVTRGVARYLGNFTPQTSRWQDQ